MGLRSYKLLMADSAERPLPLPWRLAFYCIALNGPTLIIDTHASVQRTDKDTEYSVAIHFIPYKPLMFSFINQWEKKTYHL